MWEKDIDGFSIHKTMYSMTYDDDDDDDGFKPW